VFIAVLRTSVALLLARSQYPQCPATGHLGTGFSWFPCVNKRMLRWFPTLQVATACLSCSPPDLNLLDPYFIFMSSKFAVNYIIIPVFKLSPCSKCNLFLFGEAAESIGSAASPLKTQPGIYTMHNPATDILHSPSYEDGTDCEFRNFSN